MGLFVVYSVTNHNVTSFHFARIHEVQLPVRFHKINKAMK